MKYKGVSIGTSHEGKIYHVSWPANTGSAALLAKVEDVVALVMELGLESLEVPIGYSPEIGEEVRAVIDEAHRRRLAKLVLERREQDASVERLV